MRRTKFNYLCHLSVEKFCNRQIQISGIKLCMHPANERWCYIVASSLIGWAHIQNDPCRFVCPKKVSCKALNKVLILCLQDCRVIIWTNDGSSNAWISKTLHKFNDVVWHVSWSVTGNILAVSGGDNKVGGSHHRAPFQYKNRLSRYGGSHVEDKTAERLSYL